MSALSVVVGVWELELPSLAGQPSAAHPTQWQQLQLMISDATVALLSQTKSLRFQQLFAAVNPCANGVCFCFKHLVITPIVHFPEDLRLLRIHYLQHVDQVLKIAIIMP